MNVHKKWPIQFRIVFPALLAIASCDVTSTFSICNKTEKRKLVTVVGIVRDSINLEPVFSKRNHFCIPVNSQNLSEQSCTFYLDPYETAWLEFGMGKGYYTRQVIINKTDTIVTAETIWKSEGRLKTRYLVEKKRLYTVGGDYQLVLKDSAEFAGR